MALARTVMPLLAQATKSARALKNSGVLSELRPPYPTELPAAFKGLFNITKGNWRELTVKDAWRNTLVTTEIICWFFVGECIGKGTLIGYQV